MTSYDWIRYLCPADAPPVPTRNGFFSGPGPQIAGLRQTRSIFRTLRSLHTERCVVLLGEPGIGKTTALREERDRLRAEGENVYYQELGEPGLAFEEILDHRSWREWYEGRGDLYCLLDGLDEGGSNAIRVVGAIIRKLRQSPDVARRIRMRVTCRTWHWPPSLQRLLTDFYGDEYQVCRLVPLQEKDAEAAAAQEGIDPDQFMGRVLALRAGALAARPVTLKMLLHTFKQNGRLPASQVELYEEGCERLCTEPVAGREREEVLQGGRPWPDSRKLLAVAGRIGVATICANRRVITSDEGAPTNADIPISELTGGRENVLGLSEFDVDTTLVHQALWTGLFAPEGPGRFAWTHQSYAEYLAARRLKTAPLEQIEQLLCLPQSPGAALVPQLRETAGWLAALRPDVYTWLVKVSPESLLNQSPSYDESARASMASAVLTRLREGELSPEGIDDHVAAMDHPGFGGLLGPELAKRSGPGPYRKAIIDLIVGANVVGLVPELTALALDPTESPDLREAAAGAVCQLGTAEQRGQLEPLALGKAGADSNYDLRTWGLWAVWPGTWTLDRLLEALVEPQYGFRYHVFLDEGVASGVGDAELPAAMALFAEVDYSKRRYIGPIAARVLGRVLVGEPASDTLSLAARTLLRMCRGGAVAEVPELIQQLERAPSLRFRFLSSIVSDPSFSESDIEWLVGSDLLLESDAPELTQQLAQASAQVAARWAACLPKLMDYWERYREDVEVPVERACGSQAISEPVERDSAKYLEEVSKALCEGAAEPWREWLAKGDFGEAVPHGAELERFHSSVVECSLEYLNRFMPAADTNWIEQPSPALTGGLRSLLVLAVLEALDRVSRDVWRVWAPVLLTSQGRADNLVEPLLHAAWREASDVLLPVLVSLLRAGRPMPLLLMQPVWTGELDRWLFDQLVTLPAPSLGVAADLLFEHNYRGVEVQLEELLIEAAERPPVRSSTVPAAIALMQHTGDQYWPLIRQALTQLRQMTDFLFILAGKWDRTLKASRFSPETLGDIYTLLCQSAPPEVSPDEPHSAGTMRQRIALCRDRVLDELTRMGTSEALEVLRDLTEALPQQRYLLTRRLAEAVENYRHRNWSPPSVAAVIELLGQEDRRIVQTPEQLMTVVLQALKRIEQDLRGVWSPVRFLWSKQPVQPVSENEVSDFLAYLLTKELKGRGIILNREVEIQPSGEALARGERCDLLIQALPRSRYAEASETITVVVEVKGCWHQKVAVAMKEQLVDGYLQARNGFRHGIYLVGWFRCSAWRANRRPPWPTFKQATAALQEQAAKLSRGGVNVIAHVMNLSLPD